MAFPIVIAGAMGALASVASSLVGRVLLALGLHLVTYGGLSILFDQVAQYALTNLTGLSGAAAQVAAAWRVGEVVSILSGAVAASMTLSGIRNGALTKLVHR